MSGDADGTEEYRAILLVEDDPSDAARLDLLRERGTTFLDRLDEQLAELERLGTDIGRRETPRWAYYPWRRTAVRLPGPEGFHRLRLDRNRNKITAAEQRRLRGVTVGIVGLSAGHAVAHTLALEGGCGTLRLADFDVLELSNLNRVPATVLDLGLAKTVVAARRIAELDPYHDVEVWTGGVGSDTVASFVDGLDILVDECDSLDIKVQARIAAARARIPVVMHTSDRGLVDVERFDLEPGRVPFHGLLGDIAPDSLATLSNRDKVPHVLRILGADDISTRLAASMLEIGETLETWPQLAGDVALGGTAVAAAVRGIALGEPIRSGRCRIDLDRMLTDLDDPPIREVPAPPPTVTSAPPVADDPLDAVVAAATRAPSGGNSQPWSITVGTGQLLFSLAPDPDPVRMDLHRRGSCVAVGAALYNARVAAAAHGVSGAVRVHPTRTDPGVHDVLATLDIALDIASGTDPDLAQQYESVLSRTTDRRPSDTLPLSAEDVAVLHTAAAREGGRITVLTDPAALADIAAILEVSDRIRYLTPSLRNEMVAELRWPGSPDPDSGIEVDTLGLDATEAAVLDVVLRHDVLDQLRAWDLGTGLGRVTGDRVRGSGAIVAVHTDGESAGDYVRAGSVVESVWVGAHARGLAVQPVSPIFLYAGCRSDLEMLAPGEVDVLEGLQCRLGAALGSDSGTGLALLLRIGRTHRDAPRSRRRADRVRDIRERPQPDRPRRADRT